MRNVQRALYVTLFLVPIHVASGADLRVVDGAGLVRGVRGVKGDATVIVEIVPPGQPGTTCTLKNIDGIGGDRTETSPSGAVCTFARVSAGSWELHMPPGVRWKVHIESSGPP